MKDPIAEMLSNNPLIAVSPISDMQSKYLTKLGDQLIQEFESWGSHIENFEYGYYQYWLWVLGAYEVVRTLTDHSNYRKFKKNKRRKLFSLKYYLAEIRVPFAKQSLAKKENEQAVKAFAEVMAVSCKKDLTFKIKGIEYSAKESIRRFTKLMAEIKQTDIENC